MHTCDLYAKTARKQPVGIPSFQGAGVYGGLAVAMNMTGRMCA